MWLHTYLACFDPARLPTRPRTVQSWKKHTKPVRKRTVSLAQTRHHHHHHHHHRSTSFIKGLPIAVSSIPSITKGIKPEEPARSAIASGAQLRTLSIINFISVNPDKARVLLGKQAPLEEAFPDSLKGERKPHSPPPKEARHPKDAGRFSTGQVSKQAAASGFLFRGVFDRASERVQHLL